MTEKQWLGHRTRRLLWRPNHSAIMALKERRNMIKNYILIIYIFELTGILIWATTWLSFCYQGEAQPQLKEHYNQHMMEAAFRKTAPQNLAFYLAALGSTARSAGHPSWSSNPHQTAVPIRPQTGGLSMPPGISHYEYNPSAFNLASVASANNTGHDPSFERKDGGAVNSRSSLNTVIVRNSSQ